MSEKSETKHTPGPWAISDARTVDGHPMVTGDDGAAWGLVAEVIEDADARLIAAAPKLKEALAKMLDMWGGYECPEVDAAISVMQEIGEDVWSMQAQMDAAALVSEPSQS